MVLMAVLKLKRLSRSSVIFFQAHMEDMAHFPACFIQFLHIIGLDLLLEFILEVVDNTPYTVQETEGSFDTLVAPFQFPFHRGGKHNE